MRAVNLCTDARGVRVKAADLRDATRRSEAIRAESTEPVLLDIEVLIDRDARVALAAFDALPPSSDRVRYIGTPRGLAGMIADVRALGIADAVVLVPLADCPVGELMLDELVPGLAAC